MTSSSSASSISLLPPSPAHRDAVADALVATKTFRDDEVQVALELFDALFTPDTYRGTIAEVNGQPRGFAIWGPAPMTEGTYDLYWLVTHPEAHGSGAARVLLDAVVDDVRALGGRLLLVETESTEPYARARAFYSREGLPEVARVADYYRPGADKVIGAMPIESKAP